MESSSSTEKTGTPPFLWQCNFGKYKGRTYKWICDNDVDYAKWLVTVLRTESAKNYMLSLL